MAASRLSACSIATLGAAISPGAPRSLPSASSEREFCSGSVAWRMPNRLQGNSFTGRVLRLTSDFGGCVVPFARAVPNLASVCASRNPALSPRSALVQKVSAVELDSILTNERTSPMIIDFYATWCGPCVVLAQQLEELAVEYGHDIRFLKVDTDEEHELAAQMEIRGLPTMVFVSKDVDKLAIRTEGLLPITTIREIIEKEL